MKHFCLYPFTHVATKTDGALKLCCRSEVIANIQDTSIDEYWNSESLRKIRRQMVAGERPESCWACWRSEDAGVRSMRQRAMAPENPTSRWNQYRSVMEFFDSKTGHLSAAPRTMELKTSNRCNLKCRMCQPVDSSSWAKDWPHVAHLSKEYNSWAYERVTELDLVKRPMLDSFTDEEWFLQFDRLSSQLDMIEFAGGEPLIDPGHYRLLERLQPRAQSITLKYSTNLTHLSLKSKDILSLWSRFKKVHVYISMDGTFGTYDYIRTGARFENVVANIQELKRSAINLGEVAVACTVQAYNVFNVTEVADFCLANDLKFHLHFVSYPRFLSAQILPWEIKSPILGATRIYLEKLEHAPTARHLRDFVKFLEKDRDQELMPVFLEYTRTLDRLRATRFTNSHPLAHRYFSPLFDGADPSPRSATLAPR
ncbi:MAG TPA: twitch domain-containing radical SAM protein [Bdellovibrionales bacterium]|nr:twitch domain-containing radical SAM protein [Bdellovibrionales bacterium]